MLVLQQKLGIDIKRNAKEMCIKSIPWSCSLEESGGRLFLWRERRSVLTFSIADLTEKASCNCWKSNERCSKNNAIIRIKFTLFDKEYLF